MFSAQEKHSTFRVYQ